MTATEIYALVISWGQTDKAFRQGAYASLNFAALLPDINRALREVCTLSRHFEVGISMAVTEDVDTYAFDDTAVFGRRLLEPTLVRREGVPLLNGRGRPGIWEWGHFNDCFPNYSVNEGGQVNLAVVQPGNLVRLYMTPNADEEAATFLVDGYCFAPDLVETDDIPGIHYTLHEAIAYKALEHATPALLTEPQQWERLRYIRDRAETQIEHQRGLNESQVFGGGNSRWLPGWA